MNTAAYIDLDHPELSLASIKTWFPGRWFSPTDKEAEDFQGVLIKIKAEILWEKRRRDRDIKTEEWEGACDILVRDLSRVIRETLEFEMETFGRPTGFAAARAKLLLAARECSTSGLRRHYQTGKPWHDYTKTIVKTLYNMAKSRGIENKFSVSHKEAHAIIVTSKALAACGHAGEGEPHAIVALLKRSNFDPSKT